MLRRIIHRIRQERNNRYRERLLADYLQNGQIPWSPGYDIFKWNTIMSSLNSSNVLMNLKKDGRFPENHGSKLDERVVEYPWLFSQLESGHLKILDAGSALNFDLTVDKMLELRRDVTIFTLAPESKAFWKKGVSYHFGDLCDTPFRDNYFDEIISISTLEHVGSDNTLYVEDESGSKGCQHFTGAAGELWRILKPGGHLYITVPYGADETIYIEESVFMRQFDWQMLNQLLECFPDGDIELNFYRYTSQGWQLSSQSECDDARYFNIHENEVPDQDYAAAARAVCCIRVVRNS